MLRKDKFHQTNDKFTKQSSLHVQEVVKVVPLHRLGRDALVVFKETPNGVVQGAIQTPLAVEGVGFTLGA